MRYNLSYRLTFYWPWLTVFCVSGTGVRKQSEIQRGQVHYRVSAHGQGERMDVTLVKPSPPSTFAPTPTSPFITALKHGPSTPPTFSSIRSHSTSDTRFLLSYLSTPRQVSMLPIFITVTVDFYLNAHCLLNINDSSAWLKLDFRKNASKKI